MKKILKYFIAPFCLSMIFVGVLYASPQVTIQPNQNGVLIWQGKANIVFKLGGQVAIQPESILVHWNGSDVTSVFMRDAAVEISEDGSQLSMYYPIVIEDLPLGTNVIDVAFGDGIWHSTTLTLQPNDGNSLAFSFSEFSQSYPPPSTITAIAAQENYPANDSTGTAVLRKVSAADTSKPKVKSMSVSPSSIYFGQAVSISYKVEDNVALKQVELWYMKPGGNWQQIAVKGASGKSASGSFRHTPSQTGTNKYGIHVVDKAGQWNTEGSAGPKSVTVSPRDTAKPSVTKFDISPSSLTVGASVSITFTVKDSGGSGLRQVELWRAKDNKNWAEVQRKTLSGNGPVSGSFTDKPSPAGTYYYGIHVLDSAGNWNSEGSIGTKKVTVQESSFHKPLDAEFTTVSYDRCDNNPGHGNHRGVDIKANDGRNAYALAVGTVIENHKANSACDSPKASCYNNNHWDAALIIQHNLPGRQVFTYYAHITSELKKGDPVGPGTLLGTVNLGHLHLSVNSRNLPYWGYKPNDLNESCSAIIQGGWERFQDVFNVPEYTKK